MHHTDEHIAEIADVGYTVVEDALDAELVAGLTDALADLERELEIVPADNDFEGTKTTRVYNLLALGNIWQQVPVHHAVLPIVEGVLDRGCLLSTLSSIALQPGETEQPIHADDQLMPLDKPHAPTVCNSMWALTDFTEANGATRIVPGSHRADHSPPYGVPQETIAAEMGRGSVLIWHGSLWHGGGANQTDETRVGIASNYCAGWVRQQENQQLGIPLEQLEQFSTRLRELCGFGVYNGLIGHINKRTPADVLLGGAATTNLWDSI